MPAPRPFIGDRELLLIGKILDAITDDQLESAGLSPDERQRADWMFDDCDRYLDERYGLDWNDLPVESVR